MIKYINCSVKDKYSPNSFCSYLLHYIHKYMLISSLLSTGQHPCLFKQETHTGTPQIQEAGIWRIQLKNKKNIIIEIKLEDHTIKLEHSLHHP